MDDSTTIRPRARRTWSLVGRHGEHAGTVIPLHDGFTVGRTEGSDLTLTEGLISRLHATFAIDGDMLYVRDNQSTNGTFVNDEPVDEAEVRVGDIVHFDEIGFEVSQTDVTARPGRGQAAPQQPASSANTQYRDDDEAPPAREASRGPSTETKPRRNEATQDYQQPPTADDSANLPDEAAPAAEQEPPPAEKPAESQAPVDKDPAEEPEPVAEPSPAETADEAADEASDESEELWESAEVADEGTVILGKRSTKQKPQSDQSAAEAAPKPAKRPKRRKRRTRGPAKYAAAIAILAGAAGAVYYLLPSDQITMPSLQPSPAAVNVTQTWVQRLAPGPNLSGPVVADVRGDNREEVILANDTGLLLYDSVSGSELARFNLSAPPLAVPPLIVRQPDTEKARLLVLTEAGNAALYSGLGQLFWSTPLGNRVEGSVAPSVTYSESTRNLALIPTRGRGVVAVNLATGQVAWDSANTTERHISTNLVLDERSGVFYAGGENGIVSAVDITGGSPGTNWEKKINGLVPIHLIANGNKLLVITAEGTVIALNRQHGEQMWSQELDNATLSRPTIIDAHLFCVDMNGIVYQLDLNKGEVMNRWNLGAPVEAPLSTVRDHLVILDTNARIHVIDRQGNSRFEQQVPDADIFTKSISVHDIGNDGSEDLVSVSLNGVLSRYNIQ